MCNAVHPMTASAKNERAAGWGAAALQVRASQGFGTERGLAGTHLESFKLRGCSSPPKKIWRRRSQNVPSIARVAAGAFGFLTLIQVLDGPLYQRLSQVVKPRLIVC
jgi:hypothetical protein